MKQRYKSLVIALLSIFTFFSCDKNEVIPPDPIPTPQMRYTQATLTDGLDETEYTLEQSYMYVYDNSLPDGFVYLQIGNPNYKSPVSFNIAIDTSATGITEIATTSSVYNRTCLLSEVLDMNIEIYDDGSIYNSSGSISGNTIDSVKYISTQSENFYLAGRFCEAPKWADYTTTTAIAVKQYDIEGIYTGIFTNPSHETKEFSIEYKISIFLPE